MKLTLSLALFFFSFNSFAQHCDSIIVDISKGTINQLELTATQDQVKTQLPCYTGSTEDGSEFNCGGGVFFLKNDFFFYTGNHYLEIRKDFKGILSIPVLLLNKDEAVAQLKMGEPVRTEMSGLLQYLFFKTSYGCLWLEMDNETVMQVDISAQKAEDVKLCL